MILQPMSVFVMDSWGCAGRFTADQIQSHMQLCKGRDAQGQLQPEGCAGYYEMDGHFQSNEASTQVTETAFSRYPVGCSGAFEEWTGTKVIGGHYHIGQLVKYGMYAGFCFM